MGKYFGISVVVEIMYSSQLDKTHGPWRHTVWSRFFWADPPTNKRRFSYRLFSACNWDSASWLSRHFASSLVASGDWRQRPPEVPKILVYIYFHPDIQWGRKLKNVKPCIYIYKSSRLWFPVAWCCNSSADFHSWTHGLNQDFRYLLFDNKRWTTNLNHQA